MQAVCPYIYFTIYPFKFFHTKLYKQSFFRIIVGKISDFGKKPWVIPVLLLLLVIFTSTFFRMYPASLDITDDWAEGNVNSFYKQNIEREIVSKYPNLPDQNKDKLVQEQLDEYKEQNKETIDSQIKESSEALKSRFQYEHDGENLKG